MVLALNNSFNSLTKKEYRGRSFFLKARGGIGQLAHAMANWFFRMGKIRDDKQFDIVYTSPQAIEPDPFPQVAFPGWHCDWTKGGLTKGQAVEIKTGK